MKFPSFLCGILSINSISCLLTESTAKRSLKHMSSPVTAFDIAMSVTREGLQASPDAFVCRTWIFPLDIRDQPEDGDLFTEAYTSNLDLDLLSPMLLLDVTGDEGSRNNFSYTSEFAEYDLMNPTRLGTQRLVPNCASILIRADGVQPMTQATMAMIVLKYGRPHKDFFIYFGPFPVIAASIGSNIQVQDIRYKYAVSVYNETSVHFWNGCERAWDDLDLFDRKCDTHITGHHFKAVSSSIQPFVHFEQRPDGSTKSAGIMSSIFKEASRLHNFTFDLRYAGFLGSSGFKRDGIWKGAVGEVFGREADVAFGVATTVHRFPINDPSVTQTWITRYFYIRTPAFRTPWESVFWPLNSQIWLLTAGTTLFLVIPVYYVCIVLYLKSTGQKCPKYVLFELLDALFRILMEQSATVRHWKGARIRLMILLWTAFCLVVGTGYRSKLITFLTFLEQARVPKTHEELSHSDYRLFFRWMGGVAYRHTANSPDPMHQRIMAKAAMVNTSEDCLFASLFEERSAWLDYRINAEFALSKFGTLNPNLEENPIFVRSQDSDYTCHIVWSFRKGSPLVESFDRVLLGVLAAGLYDVWKERDAYAVRVRGSKWLRNEADGKLKVKMEAVMMTLRLGPKALDNRSLFGIYLVLGLGILISTVGWMAEWAQYAWSRALKEREIRRKIRRATVNACEDLGDVPERPQNGFRVRKIQKSSHDF